MGGITIMKKIITYSLFLFCLSLNAQENKRLSEDFLNAGTREKLQILAANPFDDARERFPHLTDTIEAIRTRLYNSKKDVREEKFLLDQVDVNKATDEKNDGAGLYIIENALRYHVKDAFDSLYCFKMLRNIIVENTNDAAMMKQYHDAAQTWGPYFKLEDRRELSRNKLVIPLPGRSQSDEAGNGGWYFVVGVLVILLMIVSFFVYTRKFKKREKQLSIKNSQIQNQHKQIEQSLKEKDALIREIHHRVKNNLQIINSMLNLQIGKIDDEKTENIFFEAKQRISAIALTHQMLYQKETLSNINLSEYIETLVRQIEASMSSPLIELEVDVKDQKSRLTIDGAVPLGLVINELLTNAYKHAFPKGRKGKITVSLNETPESFTINVRDNGVGLPPDFNYSESTTLGMELVYILVEQLDSKLNVENNNGTAFSFEIHKISRHA
jgi:two-component sensor histidine kinase